MITRRAIDGLDRLLTRCLENSLKTEGHSNWRLESIAAPPDVGTPHFIMLTVSSYDFQLLVLLHFASDTVSKAYVADAIKVAPAELEVARYQDFICEIGNTFCGAFKRELGQYFPYLGMSTPNLLERESLKHLRDWSIDHQSHLKAQSGDGVAFYGSLYVTTDGELDFNFQEAAKEAQAVDTGALELF